MKLKTKTNTNNPSFKKPTIVLENLTQLDYDMLKHDVRHKVYKRYRSLTEDVLHNVFEDLLIKNKKRIKTEIFLDLCYKKANQMYHNFYCCYSTQLHQQVKHISTSSTFEVSYSTLVNEVLVKNEDETDFMKMKHVLAVDRADTRRDYYKNEIQAHADALNRMFPNFHKDREENI